MTGVFLPLALLGTLASLTVMVYTATMRSVDKTLYIIFFALTAFLYTFGYLLELTSHSLEAAYYGVRIQYVGATLMTPMSYLFVRDVYGEKRFFGGKLVAFLTVPALVLASVQLFPTLRLYYRDVSYISNAYIANCKVSPGPLYPIWMLYVYMTFFGVIRIIWRYMRAREPGQNRRCKKDLAILGAFAAPLLAGFPYLFFHRWVQYDPTPVAITLSLVLIFYAVGSGELMDVVPLARVRVIEDMQDALIICDNNLHYLDANRAAKQLFPVLKNLLHGESMERVPHFKSEGELWLAPGGQLRFFKVSQTQIMDGDRSSGVCVVFHDITEKEQMLKKLRIQATFDSLLRIYNRATFFDMARLILEGEGGQEVAYAVLMLDIDHFKQVNDTYGHPCGDIVLETLAVIIKGHFRKGDLVGRYGGEEIVVLLENLTAEEAVAAGRKLRQAIERTPIYCQEETLHVTVSIGVAHSPAGQAHDLECMVGQADAALYRAKNAGRNKVCV